MKNKDSDTKRFACIWTDFELINEVIRQTEGIIDKIKKVDIKLSIPIINVIKFEYDKKSKELIEYDSDEVIRLLDKIPTKTPLNIYNEIEKQSPFIPFVSQVEGKIILAMHLPEMTREQLKYILNFPEITKKQKREITKLIKLPNPILQQKAIDSERQISKNQMQYEITERYLKPIKSKYSSLHRDMMNEVIKEKPAVKISFRGNDFLTYFLLKDDKPDIRLPVCFPISAKNSLPNFPEFYGKVLGIVSFATSPMFNMAPASPFFLRAVALFIGYGSANAPTQNCSDNQ